jgi:hypothetical protein
LATSSRSWPALVPISGWCSPCIWRLRRSQSTGYA